MMVKGLPFPRELPNGDWADKKATEIVAFVNSRYNGIVNKRSIVARELRAAYEKGRIAANREHGSVVVKAAS